MALIPEFTGNVPNRLDSPETFSSDTDYYHSWLPDAVEAMNSIAVAMNLNETNSTSSTSLLIGTGSKSLTVEANKSYQAGMYIVLADTAAPSTNSMVAQITSYNSTTGAMVVNSLTTTGSGTKTAWTISQSAKPSTLTSPVAVVDGGTGATTSAAGLNALGGVSLTSLAADTGAALIGYKQSGAGAVSRTLDAKAKETVSVKDFGAVGDGVTDDTAAFNAALTASPSINVILVPAGYVYRITSTLVLVGNKTLRGEDSGSQNFQASFIYHDPASTGALFDVTSSSNGVGIKNLTVTGGNGSFCILSSNSYVRYEYLKFSEYNGSGIRLLSSGVGSSSSKLINCSWQAPATATNYVGYEIDVSGGDVHLRGCTAIHGAIGINIIQGQTVIIDGCSVNKQSRYSGFSSATQSNTAGIKLSGTGYKQAISIKTSYIESCDNGIYAEACESLSIEDNLMYDSGVAGVVGAWTAYGNSSIYLKDANVKNVTVKNNHITALSNGDIGNIFYAFYLNNATNVLWLNNNITTTGTYGGQFYVTTPASAYMLANTRSQSGSNPQPDYDPNMVLIELSPKLSAWVTPTFSNSWVDGGSSGYVKNNSSRVMLRSYITSGTIGSPAFTLPIGYRPAVQESFIVNSNGVAGIVTIFTNGDVVPTSGSNAYVYLSDISFQTA